MKNRVIISHWEATPSVPDQALKTHLESRGWVVTMVHGSVSGQSWGDVAWLFVMPDHTLNTSVLTHPDNALFNGYPVNVCAMQNQCAIGMGLALRIYNWGLTNPFDRQIVNDKNIYASISMSTTDNRQFAGVDTSLESWPASTNVNYMRIASALEIAYLLDRVVDGYAKVFFAEYRFDIANATALETFDAYVGSPPAWLQYKVVVTNADTQAVVAEHFTNDKEVVVDGLDDEVVYQARITPIVNNVYVYTGEVLVLFTTAGLHGADLEVQEQGQDVFSGAGELGGLPITVEQFSVQEQGQDSWGGTTGTLAPMTYQIEYWEEEHPLDRDTIIGIKYKYAHIPNLEPAKNYEWRVRAYLSENFFSEWSSSELFTAPTNWGDAQELGADTFFGYSQQQSLQAREQGFDIFSGTIDLGLAPRQGGLTANEDGQDIFILSGFVAISFTLQTEEYAHDLFGGIQTMPAVVRQNAKNVGSGIVELSWTTFGVPEYE